MMPSDSGDWWHKSEMTIVCAHLSLLSIPKNFRFLKSYVFSLNLIYAHVYIIPIVLFSPRQVFDQFVHFIAWLLKPLLHVSLPPSLNQGKADGPVRERELFSRTHPQMPYIIGYKKRHKGNTAWITGPALSLIHLWMVLFSLSANGLSQTPARSWACAEN